MKLRDLYQAMPFENTIITMRLNGAQLKQLMADNLRGGRTSMQVSGLKVEFTQSPDGSPDGIRLTHNNREVAPEDEFKVATNNYLAFGGIGGAAFTGGKDVKDTLIPVRDAMLNDFAAGPVAAPALGRIVRKQ